MYNQIISIYYGTVNPTSMGLWKKKNETWTRIKELYWDSRVTHQQLTDKEQCQMLYLLTTNKQNTLVLIEPSAASFIEECKRDGWNVKPSFSPIRNISKCKMLLDKDYNDCIRLAQGCNHMDKMILYKNDLNRDPNKLRNNKLRNPEYSTVDEILLFLYEYEDNLKLHKSEVLIDALEEIRNAIEKLKTTINHLESLIKQEETKHE